MVHKKLPVLDTDSAFDYYQSISHRLPSGDTQQAIGQDDTAGLRRAENLVELIDRFDVFVFDAFGVLNVGTSAIPGASTCINALREADKRIYILTNGASANLASLPDKFVRFGLEFHASEIISSRFCAEKALEQIHVQSDDINLWGAITCGISSVEDLNVPAVDLGEDPELYDQVDAFLFLSASTWSEKNQFLLASSMERNPRLLLVANPDVVAPKEDGFSLEPGFFSHELINDYAIPYEFHGKPFTSVYEEVERRCEGQFAAERIAMLGDTLHTDVLGANNRGWTSILVSDHGLFRGRDIDPFIAQSGITPDWIIPSI